MQPTIIILNGVGSAGKGSIARALQGIAAAPFLHVQMDSFIAMLPQASFGRPDGLVFETIEEEGRPAVVIKSGRLVQGALRGMRCAISAMAAEGLNLIVDEVMLDPQVRAEYADLLSSHIVHHVAVLASLEVLEARERQRGDRLIGLARWQYPRVHRGMSYDLEVDTSAATPGECAELIRVRFGL
jgi:chloramphenicol 3-O phosphotransferase